MFSVALSLEVEAKVIAGRTIRSGVQNASTGDPARQVCLASTKAVLELDSADTVDGKICRDWGSAFPAKAVGSGMATIAARYTGPVAGRLDPDTRLATSKVKVTGPFACPEADPDIVRPPRLCLNSDASLAPGESRPIEDFIKLDPGNDPSVTHVALLAGFFKDSPSKLKLTGATPTEGLSYYYGREVKPSFKFNAFGADLYYEYLHVPQPQPYAGSLGLGASFRGRSIEIPLFVAQYQRKTGQRTCFGEVDPPYACFERINFYEGAIPIAVAVSASGALAAASD